MIKKILADLDYANDVLIFAANLKKAFLHIEQQPISLTLVDLGLPDRNGVELIEKLHSLESSNLNSGNCSMEYASKPMFCHQSRCDVRQFMF
ncbi:hypothetical protein [Acinetobacter sp. TSRC1-2]|uniref:hypothetical protein n=1 Tax=unclassified Acinetobacter TaxID=196816 RepID=UPI003CECEC55